ncbi:MAG: hypothetical protein ABR564_00875 [Candidatus Dormibacteria bacterium]
MITSSLSTYLRDHHAAARGGLELARRTLAHNRGTDFEILLTELVKEIERDRDTLRSLIMELGVRADPVKIAVLWTAERISRFKLNGQLFRYSSLSRLVELEALHTGITAKRGLWRALRSIASADARLDGAQLDELVARAGRQLDRVEEARLRAVRIALLE